MSTDRNLLFGILAVQLDFVSRDALIDGMNAWLFDKAKPLGEVLRQRGAIDADTRTLLDALVLRHLAGHGDDPRQSLAALSSVEPALLQSLAAITDDDVRRSVAQVTLPPRESVESDPARTPMYVGPTGDASPPAAIGTGLRYRILRPHARGGLGEVYVAEDIELGRHVALKEIQGRYADDGTSRSRFVLEAEITGGLEHPGIVPVYGLGTYSDGRPFYAMRFIQGDNLLEAIKRFHGVASGGRQPPETRKSQGANAPRSADFASLQFRDLLRRFIDVCNAVAYAHSRGVLHRDLKPGNVMLGQYGETLVVDWGLAKATGRAGSVSDRSDAALQPRSGVDSSATATGQVLGTPAYMSPEQANGQLDQLGPATDVYSLGATLYEVLTGRTAFQGLPVAEVLCRVVAGEVPPPRSVLPSVPPALEAICRKAMALKPADRYPWATDLARDVERWLADEPVTAYPEPVGVRLRRWARRHARLVTGVAAALAIGLVAVGVVAWQRERARAAVAAERDRAVAARARTRAALDAMVSGVAGGSLTTQEAISEEQKAFLRSVLTYYVEFAAEPGEDREGRERLATAHHRLSLIHARLGQAQEGVPVCQRAVELYAELAADFPTVPDYRQNLGVSRNELATLLEDLGRHPEAEAAHRAALAVRETLVADFPTVPAYRQAQAGSQTNLGNLLDIVGRRPEAEAAFRAALAVQERLAADFPATPEYRQELAKSHANLGILLDAVGRRPEAEAAFRAALAVRDKLAANYPTVPAYRHELAQSHNNLATLLDDLGRRPEAEAAYRAALAVQEKLVADFPVVPAYRQDLAGSHNNLGVLFEALGKKPEAESAFRAALAIREALTTGFPAVPAYRQQLGSSHNNLGILLSALGRRPEAEAAYRAALTIREKLATDHPDVPAHRQDWDETLLALSTLLVQCGNASEAVAVVARVAAGPAPPADALYGCSCIYAQAAAATSNPDADAHAARAVELLRQAVAKGYRDVPHMLEDADLAALRRRDDYAALLWELADGLPPAK